MKILQRIALWLGLVSFAIISLSFLMEFDAIRLPLTVLGSVLIAFGIGSVEALKSYRYTVWIIVWTITMQIRSLIRRFLNGWTSLFRSKIQTPSDHCRKSTQNDFSWFWKPRNQTTAFRVRSLFVLGDTSVPKCSHYLLSVNRNLIRTFRYYKNNRWIVFQWWTSCNSSKFSFWEDDS